MNRLSDLISACNILEKNGNGDPEISNIVYDSRRVRKGSLFFAYEGVHTDGHEYIDQAVKRGASAVIHSEKLELYKENITYIRAENPRFLLSPVSSSIFNHPSTEMKVIGVTGTDGKSTTVSLIHQLMEALGRKTGSLSTVQYSTGQEMMKNPYRQSTPEAPEVHSILREMADNGCEFAVIESTSHGLSEKNNRLGDVRFNAAVLTNISHEHLEFHGTLERYISDKANLFRYLNKEKEGCNFGVVNKDEPNHTKFIEACNNPVYSYSSSDKRADIYADEIKGDIDGNEFTIHYGEKAFPVTIRLPGKFNIENTLAAVITVSLILDTKIEKIIPLLKDLKGIKGRMKHIRQGQPFSVIVDYAHSPGSFQRTLPMIRGWVDRKIITVFGSAGERDLEKRSRQGEIAGKYSDIIILTNEDPRGENPDDILSDIASGCRNKITGKELFLIEDRKEAIKKAFSLAGEGDAVLLLGKGHEDSIIFADGPLPWDEIAVAETCLDEIGYTNVKGPIE